MGRKTGSYWRNGRTARDPLTGRVCSYAAITVVRAQSAVVSPRYLSEEERITIADRHRAGESLRSIAAGLGTARRRSAVNCAGSGTLRDNTARTTHRRRPGPGVSDRALAVAGSDPFHRCPLCAWAIRRCPRPIFQGVRPGRCASSRRIGHHSTPPLRRHVSAEDRIRRGKSRPRPPLRAES